jgi:hypothetical protein
LAGTWTGVDTMRTGASGICRIDTYGDGTAEDADTDDDDDDDDEEDKVVDGAVIGEELFTRVGAVTRAA